MTRVGIVTFLVLLTGSILAGCSSWMETMAMRLTPQPTVPVETPTVAASFTPSAVVTPSLPATCAYVWSNHSLPEVSVLVNQAFQKAGLPEVEIEASAYGEDCIDTQTNQVAGFSIKQTDFYVNVGVDSVNNTQLMGDWIVKIMDVLDRLPSDQIPGPNSGDVGITFDSGSDTVNLWFPRLKAKQLLTEGIKGEELIRNLQNP